MRLLNIYRVFQLQKKEVQLQKAFIHDYLDKRLTKLETQYGGTFSPSLLKKIKGYYCILGPTVLCASYCRLTGEMMTEEERERATILSCLAPIYDDFFDNGQHTAAQINELTTDPYGYAAATFEEKVFCAMHGWMLEDVRDAASYKSTLQKIYSAQLESLKQSDPNITDEELYTITYEKSYYSGLVYHEILNEAPSEDFQAILYLISGLLQISNDAYDVYKDLQEGIYTLPNLHRNYDELMQRFTEENYRINKMIRALPYLVKQKDDYLITMNFVIARGWVAMVQLQKLLQNSPPEIDLKTIERKKLICDMEKPANISRWLLYTYRFSKK